MVEPARIVGRREAGGQHGNISTPAPPLQHQDGTTPSPPSGGGNVPVIVAGVVVPLVLIAIGAFVFYIWYRKKYPVRMVIGKDFAKFSNPAYSKRNSTLTLEKEDAENYWDTFQPSGISNPGLSLVMEDDEENMRGLSSQRAEVIDETDAKMENIERMMQGGNAVADIELKDEDTGDQHVTIVSAEITEENANSKAPNQEQNETKEGKPRKALLVNEDGVDTTFEIITESDIENQTETETSSSNESTGTHTIVLSGNELSDSENASEKSGVNADGSDKDKLKVDTTTPDNKNSDNEIDQSSKDSSANSLVESEDRSDEPDRIEEPEKESLPDSEEKDNINIDDKHDHRNLDNASIESGNHIDKDIVVVERHIDNSQDNIQSNDVNKSTLNTPETQFEGSGHLSPEENKDRGIENSSVNQKEYKESTDEDSSLEHIEFTSNDVEKRSKLCLSADQIFLESSPNTPTMLVQDAIIFEPESVSPVHFANVQDTQVRQRRAHTIECVTGDLKRLDDSNIVSKEWYSFDDIDKMDPSTSGIGLFEPIRKLTLDSSSNSSNGDNKLEQIETPGLESDTSKDMLTESDNSKDDSFEKTGSYESSTLINESIPVGLKSTSSGGSLSFEVVHDFEAVDATSEVNPRITHSDLFSISMGVDDQQSKPMVSRVNENTNETVQGEYGDEFQSNSHVYMLDSDPSIEVIDSSVEERGDENMEAGLIVTPEKDNVIIGTTEENYVIENNQNSSLIETVENDDSVVVLSDSLSFNEISKNAHLNAAFEKENDDIQSFEETSESSLNATFENNNSYFGIAEINIENGIDNNKNMLLSDTNENEINNVDLIKEDVMDTDTELDNYTKAEPDCFPLKNPESKEDSSVIRAFDNNELTKDEIENNDSIFDSKEEPSLAVPDSNENMNKQVIKPPGFSFFDDLEENTGQDETSSSSNSSIEDTFNQFSGLMLNSSTPNSSSVIDPYKNTPENESMLREQGTQQAYDFLGMQDTTNPELSESYVFDQDPILDISSTTSTPQRMLSNDSSLQSWDLLSEHNESNTSLSKDENDSSNALNIANVDLLGLSTDTAFQVSSHEPESPNVNESSDFTDLLGENISSTDKNGSVANQSTDFLDLLQPTESINTKEMADEKADASWDILDDDTEA